MYKDPDRQREANRERQRRYKARHKGVTSEGVTDKALPTGLTNQGGVKCEGFKIPKRGKDIKCFEDLPPDVQQTIDRISESPGEKRRRTGIAIHYQHLFPDRYHSTGIAI